ncbi:MAG: 30S ribosomal protein S21 [Planctomycetes bacterium]|nr:30S ribosomal protein S21 [Planctomycetota bacterium]
MVKVQIRPNEPLEAALRRFKRQCNYAGIFRLSKKYAFYEKRSDKRRREERERIRNIQRAIRKSESKGKPRPLRKGGRGDRRESSESENSVPSVMDVVTTPITAAAGKD